MRRLIFEIVGLLLAIVSIVVTVSYPEIRQFLHLDQPIPKALFHSDAPSSASLEAVCLASPRVARVGEPVTFQANALGGSGYFAYSWVGDDGVASTYRMFTVTYASPGRKAATVRATSAGTSVYRTCEVTVEPAAAKVSDER
jgi:hypothetical protein